MDSSNKINNINNVNKTSSDLKNKINQNQIRMNSPSVSKENINEKDKENKERNYSEKEITEATKEANRIVFGDEGKLEFKIHEGTGRLLVKLVNKETNEIIREIPPEKILDLIANIWEMVGILVDERG